MDDEHNRGLHDVEIVGLTLDITRKLQSKFNVEDYVFNDIILATISNYLQENNLRIDIKPELKG